MFKEKKDIFEKYDLLDVDESFPIPEIPESGLVLIVGSSGSGKSTILRKTLKIKINKVSFDDRPIYKNFSSSQKAEQLLTACGLRTIPAWKRPYKHLSNGEQHRAFIALSLDKGYSCIDEFTSVVDRNTAKSLCVAISKFYKRNNIKRLILATCHRDIIQWLCPDHIYDTDKKTWLPRGCLQRPKIKIEIYPSTVKDWVYFKKHHYLSSSISKSCHCYTGYFFNQQICFSAIIHGCGRDIKSYWRESRLVVIPEFQGLGIGVRFSEAVAEEYTKRGLRFFSKTAHPAMGEYRNNHPEKWRATSTNMKKRTSYLKTDGTPRLSKGYGKTKKSILRDYNRVCYSHEYIG